MDKTVTNLWAETHLSVWPERYWLISVAPASLSDAAAIIAASSPHFATIIMEHDEVSLTVCDEVWQERKERLPGHKIAGPYTIITFALNVDLGVCGYLLPAAERLAEAGISIMPQCAYLKDHLAIKEENAAQAVHILDKLIAECRDTARPEA
jgi:hypothetical protein